MTDRFKTILAAGAIGACGLAATARIPLDYYAPLDGLSGRELKQAIHEITSSDVKMLKYGGRGNAYTWWGFYITDRTEDGHVRDRYSPGIFDFAERGTATSGMNIEHSFPKSWWGGAENNAYKDLFNLMPCEATINNHKSNYPMGPVDTEWRGNGVTSVGWKAGDSQEAKLRYWEPADNWKGDFARGYLYMATAYQDFTWSGDQAVRILDTNAYPTLQEWAYTLYLDWAEADPVDAIETVRNNDVERMQGNRNPFVDFPNLAQYVWGDSVGVPFRPLTSVKSQEFTGGGTIGQNSAELKEIYTNTFLGDEGNCTITLDEGSASGIRVWYNDAQYGWKASGSRGSGSNLTRYQTGSTLWLPELDLTGYKSASVTFEHAANFVEVPSDVLSLEVLIQDEAPAFRAGAGAAAPHVQRWPLGINWDFVKSGTVDLTPFCGHRLKVGFHYTSTTSEAAVWEIKNLAVTGEAGEAGIEFIEQDMLDSEDSAPEEYYTIDGRRIFSPEDMRGLVIVRRGSHVSKRYIP